jgi:hypothetical protein
MEQVELNLSIRHCECGDIALSLKTETTIESDSQVLLQRYMDVEQHMFRLRARHSSSQLDRAITVFP